MLSREESDHATNGHATDTAPRATGHDPQIPPSIEEVIGLLVAKFAERNAGYRGGASRWLENFLVAQPVARGLLSPVEYAAVLAAKQDDAVFAALARLRKGEEGALEDLRERLTDGAVYRAIILAMLSEGVR